MRAALGTGAKDAEPGQRPDLEAQHGPEAGVGVRLLRRIVTASDPESRHPFLAGARHDPLQQRAIPALAAVWRQGHAVPDVGLAFGRSDLETELADPLRPCRQPSVGDDGALLDDAET